MMGIISPILKNQIEFLEKNAFVIYIDWEVYISLGIRFNQMIDIKIGTLSDSRYRRGELGIQPDEIEKTRCAQR